MLVRGLCAVFVMQFDDMTSFFSSFSSVNLTVCFLDNMTSLECLENFIAVDVIKHIVSCVNDNAITFFFI